MIFFFALISAQDVRRVQRCEERQKKDSILYKKLIYERKFINYDGLAIKIIKDIDLTKLPKQSLIFVYHERYVPNPFDNEPCFCCFEELSAKPNYNGTVFWTKKNIKLMVKKFKKNIIPRNDLRKEFIYDKLTSKSTTILRKLIVDTRKQKEGNYIEMYKGKNLKEEQFFYYPFNNKKDLVIMNNTGMETKNYDELELIFTNQLYGKVSVEFRYNYNYAERYRSENSVIKTYQYQNKKWVEIPIVEEYKF